MNNKVKALVDWVATGMSVSKCEGCDGTGDDCNHCHQPDFQKLARQILSYPDLALIDKGEQLITCTFCEGSGEYSYDTKRDCPYCHGNGARKQKIVEVIRLAEAIKETADEH